MTKKDICFVGAGALASSLALLLSAKEYRITEIVTRDGASARKLARKVGARTADFDSAQWTSKIVWLAVPDGAIAECAERLAANRSFHPEIVLHSSAVLNSRVMLALKKSGASLGSAHPMMTFVAGRPPEMKGVWWALEGEQEAVRAAGSIARSLGSKTFRIASNKKALYHAFGVMISPLLVSAMTAAREVGLAAGVEHGKVQKVMAPIVRRTVENLLSRGGEASFSGPFVRGDLQTIQTHLEALEKLPQERAVYLQLARYALTQLPVRRKSEIERLLS